MMLSWYVVRQIHGFPVISSKIKESLMWPVSYLNQSAEQTTFTQSYGCTQITHKLMCSNHKTMSK